MISWTPNNLTTHQELVKRVSRAAGKTGHPVVVDRAHGHRDQLPHVRHGGARRRPIWQRLDRDCSNHDVKNLYVADSTSTSAVVIRGEGCPTATEDEALRALMVPRAVKDSLQCGRAVSFT
jgi:hypothetical protein